MRRPRVAAEWRLLAGAAIRLAVAQIVLRPAADHLSRDFAGRIADLVGALSARTPHGRRVAGEFERAFGAGSGARIAAGWFARPFRDFAALQQVARGRCLIEAWGVRERIPAAAERIRDSGSPYVVATGHFSREAVLHLYVPSAIPGRLSTLVARLPGRSRHPAARRVRLQCGTSLRAVACVRPQTRFVYVREAGQAAEALNELRRPEGALLAAVDATAWRGPLVRPFAGRRSREFALGTARLARLAGCPILPCVPYLDDEGGVVLEWGEPIPPPARRDRLADRDVTSAVLDVLEVGVGRRPDQYVVPTRGERRWNPATATWRDPAD